MPKLITYINASYIKKTKLINDLSCELFPLLPPSLMPHCRIANLDTHLNELVILCDSPAWANKLRYYQAEIMRHFQVHHKRNLRNIKIGVSLKSAPHKSPSQKLYISGYSAQKLKSLAESLPDIPLKAALLRLSRRG